MERPRAPPRARAIPRRPPSRAAFPSSPRVWARCLRRLPSSCGACRWSRRTITRSRPIVIRLAPLQHPLCAVASSTAMAWRLSRTVPHWLSWPTATLPRMRFWFAILPTCLECLTWRSFAIFRTIQRAPRAYIPSRRTSVAPRLPIFRSMPASSRASRLPSVPSASIHMARRHAISWAIPAPLPPSSSRPRIRKPLAMKMLLLARLRTSRAIS